MQDFLTTQQTSPPPIPLGIFILMMGCLLGLTLITLRYYQRPAYRQTFRILQVIQLLALYSWYQAYHLPLAQSLPLYHCRLAMIALLVLPGQSPIKQYCALLGLSGALMAFAYPVFDPYDFPHVTSFSFILGHYALWVNALIYLLRFYQSDRLPLGRVVFYTLVLNAGLVWVNHLTGGNYGLLRTPPFIPGEQIALNYLLVSLILCLVLYGCDRVFHFRVQRSRA